MSTSATLPNTIQIRPSRLAGLFVAVAIVTGVTTWSVSQFTTESHARSSPASDVVSPSPATQAYVNAVVALDAQQRTAIFGNLTPTQRYVQGVAALTPEQQAAIWGNVSPNQQYVNAVRALTPEQQSAIYGNVGGAGAFIPPAHANGVDGAGGPLAAIGGAGAFIPFTPPES